MAFLKSENVLSPGGRLLCRLLRGPFVFNLGFIGLDYRTGGFKIFMGKCVFEKLENVLFGPNAFRTAFRTKLLWGNVFSKNHAKSKVFQNNWRPQAFFVKI